MESIAAFCEGKTTLARYSAKPVSPGRAAVSALLACIGFSRSEDSLWSYLSSERYDIVDLMDLCDRRGIPYEFSSSGSGGDCQFRPAEVS